MSLRQQKAPLALAAGIALAVLAASPAVAVTRWAVQPTPNPSTGGSQPASELDAISCSSATACTVVGAHVGHTVDTPLAERWNGKTWKLQAMPGHGSAGNLFVNSVSCPTARDCTAVGEIGSGRGTSYHWDGSRWSVVPTAAAAPKGNLWAVSCPSARTCIAVGEYGSGSVDSWFAERWNGTSWSVLMVEKNKDVVNNLACTSAASCIATGGRQIPGGIVPLAVHWDGHAWKAQQAPKPAHFPFAALGGISCSSATSCVSVGAAQGTTTGEAFAERWNGTSWSLLPRLPNAQADYPTQVSCLPNGHCIAVGNANPANGNIQVLAESWDGTRWAIEPAPSPGRKFSVLNGVSCPAISACEAAGAYQKGNSQFTLAERRF